MRAMGWFASGAAFAFALAGCATGYQPLGATGGYKDERLEKDTYKVSYFGNGETSRQAVFKYFLYRCAELTIGQGYEYFEIYASKGDAPRASANGIEYAEARATYHAPTIVYVPGRTVTRWSVTGIIRMYPKDILAEASELFSAHEVIDLLGAEVLAGTPTSDIPEKFRRVEGKFPVAPPQARESTSPPPAPSGGGPVKLDDLKDLLPK